VLAAAGVAAGSTGLSDARAGVHGPARMAGPEVRRRGNVWTLTVSMAEAEKAQV
jgi:hypothetical protein